MLCVSADQERKVELNCSVPCCYTFSQAFSLRLDADYMQFSLSMKGPLNFSSRIQIETVYLFFYNSARNAASFVIFLSFQLSLTMFLGNRKYILQVFDLLSKLTVNLPDLCHILFCLLAPHSQLVRFQFISFTTLNSLSPHT